MLFLWSFATALRPDVGPGLERDEQYNATRPRLFDESWVLDHQLVSSTAVTSLKTEARYFTLYEDLYAKIGETPAGTPYDQQLVFRNCTVSLVCDAPSVAITDINAARNTAYFEVSGRSYALGGEHSMNCGEPGDPCGPGASLLVYNGTWHVLTTVLNGHHPGCIEARFERCEYDGKWSVTVFHDVIYVYGRANLAMKGGRWTTVTKLAVGDFERALRDNEPPEFGPFEPIKFAHGTVHPSVAFNAMAARRDASLNLYYFSVNAINDTLVAFFPVSTRDRAFLALAVSCDGVTFSAPHPLVDSQLVLRGHGHDRAIDHTIDGFLRRDHGLHFYAQINVPGIAPQRATLRHHRKKRKGLWYPPHLVDLRIDEPHLRAYAARAKRGTHRPHDGQVLPLSEPLPHCHHRSHGG